MRIWAPTHLYRRDPLTQLHFCSCDVAHTRLFAFARKLLLTHDCALLLMLPAHCRYDGIVELHNKDLALRFQSSPRAYCDALREVVRAARDALLSLEDVALNADDDDDDDNDDGDDDTDDTDEDHHHVHEIGVDGGGGGGGGGDDDDDDDGDGDRDATSVTPNDAGTADGGADNR
jgi:hypothetical protein